MEKIVQHRALLRGQITWSEKETVQRLKINQKRMKFVFWLRHFIHFYEKMSLFAIYDISEDKFDNFLGCLLLQKHAQLRMSRQVV